MTVVVSSPSVTPANLSLTSSDIESPALLTFTTDATASTNGSDQVNRTARGVVVNINISAITGTSPTLTVTLQGKDPVSGQYYTILASAALAAVAFTQLTVYPGIAASANVSANANLPSQWRVVGAIGGTTPAVTATVGAVLLP